MYKAVFRVKSIRLSEVRGAVGHITRELKERGSHIDSSIENVVLIGSSSVDDIKHDLEEEAALHKVLNKKAGVKFCEGILTANKDYFNENYRGWQNNADLLKPWIDANLRFLRSEKVGIVKSAILHLDEEAPHVHFVSVPVSDVILGNRYGSKTVNRMSYNAMFSDSMQHIAECRKLGTTSTKTKLGRLQTLYAESVESLDLERGVTSSVKHITPARFRKMLGNKIDLTKPNFSLEEPSVFSYKKTHFENVAMVEKLNDHLTKRAEIATNSVNALRIKNQILSEKIQSQEKTIMQLTSTIEDQAAVLRENKDFISSSRLLSREAVIESFGYSKSTYEDYNFDKKFNAIDFVKHVEKCDFNRALILISEHFPNYAALSAAQSETVLKSFEKKINNKSSNYNNNYNNSDEELIKFKSEISLFDFARARGFSSRSQSVTGKSSVTMSDGQTKIVVSRKNGNDVFFDVKNSSIRGSIIDFCKHYFDQNLGEVRKTLRAFISKDVKQVNKLKTPTILTESKSDFTDKTLDFYALKSCEGSKYLAKRGVQIVEDEIRVDVKGNVCFPHYQSSGAISGWEVKGEGFKGFSSGGKKGFGLIETGAGESIVISESMLDALSYAQLHTTTVGACVSTGGGIGEDQLQMLVKEVLDRNRPVLIATDNDVFGDELAARLQSLIPRAKRARPSMKDWNDVLQSSLKIVMTDTLLSTEVSTHRKKVKSSETRIHP